MEPRNTRPRWASTRRKPRDLPPGLAERIQHISKRTYKVLQLSGYGRIDLRLDAAGGRPRARSQSQSRRSRAQEDFAESAAKAGLPYPALIQRILTIGMRWEPERGG